MRPNDFIGAWAYWLIDGNEKIVNAGLDLGFNGPKTAVEICSNFYGIKLRTKPIKTFVTRPSLDN